MPKVSNKQYLISQSYKLFLQKGAKNLMEGLTSSEKHKTLVNGNRKDLIHTVGTLIELNGVRYTILRNPVPKSIAWMTKVLPELDDFRFRQHLRVTSNFKGRAKEFQSLLQVIEGDPVFLTNGQQAAIEKQLQVTLWRFGHSGTGASMYNVSKDWGLGDGGTADIFTSRVIRVTDTFLGVFRLSTDLTSIYEIQKVNVQL